MDGISGPRPSENGSFESTEDLLKSRVSPNVIFMAQIINGTIQNSNEVDNSFRSSAMQALGKGLRVDTTA